MKRNLLLILLLTLFFSLKAQKDIAEDFIGLNISYQYEKGNAYHVKLTEDGLSYRFLSGSKPEKWWGAFDFKMIEKDKGEYIISWFEEGFGDHVTLIIDFKKNILYGSAVVYGKNGVFQHLQKAIISDIKMPKLDGE